MPESTPADPADPGGPAVGEPRPAVAPADPAVGEPAPAVAPADPAAPHRSLVHHPDFRRLWGGDALGQLGAQLSVLAVPVLAVQTLDATPWQMGALTASETAAFLVIGLPAGAWVDRMRKRRTLVVADLVRATILAAVAVAALTGHASMPLLYVAALAMSAATVFFDVAYQSYVPVLVGRDHIVEGNSKLQATQSVAQAVGPALGGALLRVMAAALLLAANAVTYLASAAWLARIRAAEELPDPAGRRPMRAEIREGLDFVLHHPLLRRVVACTGLSNLGTSIGGALLTLYVLRTLGLDEAALGACLSASAVGGVVGALAADRVSRRLGEGRVIPLSMLASAPGWALLPLAAPLARLGVPAVVPLVLGGFAFYVAVVVYNVAQVSFRQRLCPPALLGRMNASVRFLVWGPMPVGGLVGGWLGTHVGVVATLWVSVAGLVVSALPVALSPLWRMRELPGGVEPDGAGEPSADPPVTGRLDAPTQTA